MSWIRATILILCFCGEVHVRADTTHAPSAGCWGKTIPCAEQSLDHQRRVLRADGLTLTLGAESILQQRTESSIQLVRGLFYVETSKTVQFQTPFARLSCLGSCEALLRREPDQVVIKSLRGEWIVMRTGEDKRYAVVAGMQVQVGEIGEDGKAQMEFPQSLPWAETIREWGQLFPGKLDQFKVKLGEFHPIWQAAVGTVSDLHQTTVNRELASYDRGQARQKARELSRAAEDESLRSLFRQKNYVDP